MIIYACDDEDVETMKNCSCMCCFVTDLEVLTNNNEANTTVPPTNFILSKSFERFVVVGAVLETIGDNIYKEIMGVPFENNFKC